jgi:threonine/homoserine/homoserine lactone efflux protein
MEPGLFLRGLAIGFAVAFALGPIGLLVIRRTIDRGWTYGLLSGTGVATADAAYGAVAAFGLTAITEALVGVDRPLGIVGGAVLLVLAARGLRAVRNPAPTAGDDPDATRDGGRRTGRLGAWASMVGLTLTNPATILSFAALFASIGAGTGGPAGAASVVGGVFLGSVAWWAILTALVAGLRARLTLRVIRALNVASAAIIAAFGVAAIVIGIRG